MTRNRSIVFLRPWNRVLSSSLASVPRNPYLKQVISQGMSQLEDCTTDVYENTKEDLFPRHVGPSQRQLAEASRILEVVSDVVEKIAGKTGEFCVGGSSIEILDVEVSPDCKRARVLWCLPLTLAQRLDEDSAEIVTQRMHAFLEAKGVRTIQSHVFGRLRFYYPPKLQFVPVPLHVAIESFIQDS